MQRQETKRVHEGVGITWFTDTLVDLKDRDFFFPDLRELGGVAGRLEFFNSQIGPGRGGQIVYF